MEFLGDGTGQKAYEEKIAAFLLSTCCWPGLLTETYSGDFQAPHRHICGVSIAAIKTLPWKYSQII
jgi:hypothetical protein